MIRALTILLLFSYSALSHATEYDICKGAVIDDVTEQAFGQHGILYTGEIVCYRDAEKTILKYKRTYDHGKPIGRHICYKDNGVPHYSISYDHTSVKKYSLNYALFKTYRDNMDCTYGIDGACWKDRPCTAKYARCTFHCP